MVCIMSFDVLERGSLKHPLLTLDHLLLFLGSAKVEMEKFSNDFSFSFHFKWHSSQFLTIGILFLHAQFYIIF